jgi:anti-sigma regulatory factor (Ser/Thr protein kinase)
MTGKESHRESIKGFILDNIAKHPSDITKLTSSYFKITRQAVNKHLKKLVMDNLIIQEGQTRRCVYKLKLSVQEKKEDYKIFEQQPLEWKKKYFITPGLAEDIVWRNDIFPLIEELPKNVLSICEYGFTEMFNNAIDHSEGSQIAVELYKTSEMIRLNVADDGVGIFKKIQKVKNLIDERHALFELSKGKLTTDPKNHTGQGIFFSSRAFDSFNIISGELIFTHNHEIRDDYICDKHYFNQNQSGTCIGMAISTGSIRNLSTIFLDYGPEEDDYQFNKTVIPIKLAQYESDSLVSRSQAKRILARIDLFKRVILDFSGVESVGQAFADEIFRVFQSVHPHIELIPINCNVAVEMMIWRAKSVKL